MPTVSPRDPEWPDDRVEREVNVYMAQIQVGRAHGPNSVIVISKLNRNRD